MRSTNKKGYYGPYGGRFVPETLVAALDELEQCFDEAKRDRSFKPELRILLRDFAGRPTPLYFATNLTKRWKGGRIFLKREDLNHTGAHKINNTVGQILLARRLGKTRVVAETGAGQHGTAVAATCAMMGIKCVVYMGSHDAQRQHPNVLRMRYLGAEVREVSAGLGTLKEATSEAIRDWVTNVRNTHYIIGSTVGPHPYPLIVREFQSVIGREARVQILRQVGMLPNYVLACIGGGSNAMGIFAAFLRDREVKLIGVESAGKGLKPGMHAAPLAKGSPGVLHGARSYLLQDHDGQIELTTTISAGLDYPGVGPEHANLKDTGRVKYVTALDKEAVAAFKELCEYEGIIPALESSFALAYGRKLAGKLNKKETIIINLSGRGDKDMQSVIDYDK
jgi:tryptophan synthase beta chain